VGAIGATVISVVGTIGKFDKDSIIDF
jgi:hypothetical protein